MPDETNTPTQKPGGWSAARKHLATWDNSALLALIKDLYDTAAENRDFILARAQVEDDSSDVLDTYRRRVVEQFFPRRGDAKLKLGEARKAIRDYQKATGSIPGTAELLMSYVENGVKFTREYGDINERFYNSVESALYDLAALLRGAARKIYPQFRVRLAKVAQLTNGIGWGFHDSIADVVGRLEDEFGEQCQTGSDTSSSPASSATALARTRTGSLKRSE